MIQDNHPWEHSLVDFKCRILPVLEKSGKLIGEKSIKGDENSIEIIRLYTLLHRSFDPMTAFLLEDALKSGGYLNGR